MPNLLFYNQQGHGEYYRVDALGSMARFHQADDYRKSWTTIVHLQSGPDSTAQSIVGDVLFYDRQAGRADVYRFDDTRAPRHLRTSTTFSKAWQHITPVYFDGHTNVVFYDADGFAEIWRYADYGEFVHLKTVTGLPPVADAIVSGNFGGKRGGVVIYDREAGQGRVYRLDEETGAMTLVRTHSFAKTWTQIVPVPFGFRTDLLFYSPAGVAEVYRLDGDGQMEQISRYLDLAKTWQHIVAFERDADPTRPFVYFYAANGTAQLYSIDGLGQLQIRLRPRRPQRQLVTDRAGSRTAGSGRVAHPGARRGHWREHRPHVRPGLHQRHHHQPRQLDERDLPRGRHPARLRPRRRHPGGQSVTAQPRLQDRPGQQADHRPRRT